MRIALIPGSFDPFHNGHLEIVERAAKIFDEIVVAAIRNPQKSEPLFTLDERREMIAESGRDHCVDHDTARERGSRRQRDRHCQGVAGSLRL